MMYVEKIKSHPFFEGVDWDDLKARKRKAVFIPDDSGESKI